MGYKNANHSEGTYTHQCHFMNLSLENGSLSSYEDLFSIEISQKDFFEDMMAFRYTLNI